MPESLADRIIECLPHVNELYYRFVVVVAPASGGKTSALLDVHRRTGAPIVNVNLELSRLMLDLTSRQRTLQIPGLLASLVEESMDVILLDNIEMLFDRSLKQDPLRLLRGISRNRTLVVAWSGSVTGSQLVYAAPGHPEFRRYPIADIPVVNATSA